MRMAPGSEPGPAAQVGPAAFRTVLGRYPTGVCLVAAAGVDGQPLAMVVGSFTSVSLDPPLVAFLPAQGSATWPKLRARGRFCVNVLARQHEGLARALAARAPDPFRGQTLGHAANGAPMLPGAVAWILCDLEQVIPAGDHDIALCRVTALETGSGTEPLIFLQGGFTVPAGPSPP